MYRPGAGREALDKHSYSMYRCSSNETGVGKTGTGERFVYLSCKTQLEDVLVTHDGLQHGHAMVKMRIRCLLEDAQRGNILCKTYTFAAAILLLLLLYLYFFLKARIHLELRMGVDLIFIGRVEYRK